MVRVSGECGPFYYKANSLQRTGLFRRAVLDLPEVEFHFSRESCRKEAVTIP